MDALETPALLVDSDRLDRNLGEMADLAREAGVALRPHWKTHKCPDLARRQIELGAVGGTVAKAGEAEIFFAAGFEDLLVATPVVDPRKIDRLLAARGHSRLAVLVESLEGARLWGEGAARAGKPVTVLLEVDTGMRRTGVTPGDEAVPLGKNLAGDPWLEFRGVLTHAGHAYGARSSEEIAEIGRTEGETLVRTAESLRAAGIECPVVSVGSTPTVRYSMRVSGVTEIRPGNYPFHDVIQVGLGVVPEDRCALSLLATVVARPAPDRVVVDSGSKSLSSDRGVTGGSLDGFGRVLGPDGGFRQDAKVVRLSEEHGILEVEEAVAWSVGDRIRIVPNHACATVNLHRELHLVRGADLVESWEVAARGRIV